MRVIVVGGGIMGLSTALSLRRQGHRVTIFEQASIPNPLGSSVDQHRLIRHPYGQMGGYSRMVGPALRAWSQTWDTLGQSYLHPTGTLILARDNLEWAESSISDMADMGIEHSILNSTQLKTLAPMLSTSGIELAAWVNSGGILLAEEIIRAMARCLVMQGVVLNTHTPVIDIDPIRSAITLEDGSQVRADRLVVTAGPWVRDIFPAAMGRIKPSRQLVLYLKPPKPLAEAWQKTPMVLDIQGNGGIYVVPPVASTGLKVGDHSFSMKGHPSTKRTANKGEISVLFEACRNRILDLNSYEISETKICFYTVQKDERFIVENIDKAVLMSGFSGHGFKFGALMGAIASGMLNGTIHPNEGTRLAAGTISDPNEISRLTNLCLD